LPPPPWGVSTITNPVLPLVLVRLTASLVVGKSEVSVWPTMATRPPPTATPVATSVSRPERVPPASFDPPMKVEYTIEPAPLAVVS
jgi:hypothetical protein